MKEIKALDATKLKADEIEVKPFLTYDEIQAICNAICKFDSWAEREQNKDVLLLHFATNLTDEEIEEIGHDAFVQSGLMTQVRDNVLNYNQIDEAVAYTQSTQRALAQILNELPQILEPLKKVVNHGSKKR